VGGASISPKLESRKDSAQNSLALETPKSSAPKQLTGAAKGATKPLMKQPLTIEGTGDNGRTTLFDLAGALGKWSQEGLKPDKEIKNALDRSRAEMTYQIAQDNGDANWYKKDTKDAIEHLQANGFPELEKPVNEKLFRTMWAITSYGVDPDANLTSAAEAWKQYQATGKMPLMADEKTNWPGYSGIKGSITLLNKLLDEKGEAGTMDWLLSKHPVSEIREQKAKTHTAATVPGRASDERYGAFIFGPKAGAFMLNLQGVSEHTTVDVWGARMIRRWTGTLSPETIDQPLTSEEARNFHHVIESMGKEFGLDTADAQAVLWGYEHDLYKAHGVGEAAKSYKTAAEKYVQRKQGGTNNEFIREQSDLFGQRYGSSGKKTEGVGKNAATEGRAPSSKKGIDAQSLIAALGGLKKPASEFPSDISVSPWMTDADGDHRLELTKKGKLAGLIQYGADPIGGSAEIHDVYLDESLRGKGLGTKLYEQAFKHAAAQGLMSVTSDEAEISDAAQKVWRGLKASGKYDITKSTHEDGYPKFTAWLGGKK
jgi:GNAT superfamily N-acetyltransferase